MPEFPENAITKKKGDKSVYDWVEITVKYVIPRIATFQAAKVQPTIRGLYYFLTDSQVIAKGGKFYKSFDSAMVDARKKKPGERGYIPPGTFSDNTRRIIDIDDTYFSLEDKALWRIKQVFGLCHDYSKEIPRWLAQPNYVEVWSEKDTMTGTLYSILRDKESDRHVRIAPNRSWSSFEFLHKNIERLEDQITKNEEFKSKTIKDIWILYVGDFDSSGLKMDEYYDKELKLKLVPKLNGQVRLHFKRIGLTWDQITTFKLEHLKNATLSDFDRDKLENDPNGEWFEEKYGSRFQIQVDSLQTLEPAKFKKLLTDEVDILFSKKIRKEILSRPEHSKSPEEIWDDIKYIWIYQVARYGFDYDEFREAEDKDDGG